MSKELEDLIAKKNVADALRLLEQKIEGKKSERKSYKRDGS